jgi:hypothetical protein
MIGERLFHRKTIRLKKEFLKREVLHGLTWSKLSLLERVRDERLEEKVTKEEISIKRGDIYFPSWTIVNPSCSAMQCRLEDHCMWTLNYEVRHSTFKISTRASRDGVAIQSACWHACEKYVAEWQGLLPNDKV